MDWDQVLEIAAYVLPALAALITAKVVNNNSPHWSLWTGRVGKIVGILVAILDAMRDPRKVYKEVKPANDIKKAISKVTDKNGNQWVKMGIFMVVLPGLLSCAGWQLTGNTWQENATLTIARVHAQVKTIKEEVLPNIRNICDSFASQCNKELAAASDMCKYESTCKEVYNGIVDGLVYTLEALVLAEEAVEVSNQGNYDAAIARALVAVGQVIDTLTRMGVMK